MLRSAGSRHVSPPYAARAYPSFPFNFPLGIRTAIAVDRETKFEGPRHRRLTVQPQSMVVYSIPAFTVHTYILPQVLHTFPHLTSILLS
jgi:hypothetical protein